MPRATRSNAQQAEVLSRRSKVAELLLRGVSNQLAICAKLGLERSSRSMIYRDIQAIKAEWKQSAVRDFDEAVGIELAKLDALEREYWQGWERSQREWQGTRTTKTEVDDGKSAKQAEVRKEQRDGSQAFLDGVMKCITRRCELLGLDAPKRMIHSGDEDAPIRVERAIDDLTEDELRALQEFRRRIISVAPQRAIGD
jgi:hypothetical protein